MQLSADFPHSRHEQYVIALPYELRSRAETLEAIAVLHRGLQFSGPLSASASIDVRRARR
ncbi:MAG TPA: hypothetical protein VK402_20430 [Blastococcus sp.]|nr:hypothetical protein [Blastococcus sp.]